TRVVGIEGNGHLERVTWREMSAGRTDTQGFGHLFVMACAIPNTQGRERRVILDAQGCVQTGPDLTPKAPSASRWPLDGSPRAWGGGQLPSPPLEPRLLAQPLEAPCHTPAAVPGGVVPEAHVDQECRRPAVVPRQITHQRFEHVGIQSSRALHDYRH